LEHLSGLPFGASKVGHWNGKREKTETKALGGDSAALIGMNEKSVDAGGTLNLVRARQSFAERLRCGEIFEMVTSSWRSKFVGVSARPRSGLSVHPRRAADYRR